eukprot:TRINITY_DN26674_c0_g1_i1.p1 TRINITY_DN26674_c0_g1~~TRINITY_DN26674_c0_g1_i1.p1  ORF type:complete len:210 (-),score=21.64 TRINITY_DN26674_c0_g1_i1:169-798(-)
MERDGRGGGCRAHPPESEFILQWGNRKRLRCMKIQMRGDTSIEKTAAVRVGRRVVRADKESSLPPPPSPNRILRNSETSAAMRSQNNGNRTFSPLTKMNGGGSASSETGQDKKGGSSSSSGNEARVWPKLEIGLTNKEKEEDFLAIKGSKLPQRPKKRAKFVQRTLNLVCPGSWLADLSLERYEVREKKISKKRPRGLKAMGDMGSDSE